MDDTLGRLIEALAEAKAARIVAELALTQANQALAEVRGMKESTHRVQYVDSTALGQINKDLSQYGPDIIDDETTPLATFDLGKQLAGDDYNADLEEEDETA